MKDKRCTICGCEGATVKGVAGYFHSGSECIPEDCLTALCDRVSKLENHIVRLLDVIFWMSGSEDFSPEGKAYQRWLKVQVDIEEAQEVLADMNRDDIDWKLKLMQILYQFSLQEGTFHDPWPGVSKAEQDEIEKAYEEFLELRRRIEKKP